jgi:hypothetical protein
MPLNQRAPVGREFAQRGGLRTLRRRQRSPAIVLPQCGSTLVCFIIRLSVLLQANLGDPDLGQRCHHPQGKAHLAISTRCAKTAFQPWVDTRHAPTPRVADRLPPCPSQCTEPQSLSSTAPTTSRYTGEIAASPQFRIITHDGSQRHQVYP